MSDLSRKTLAQVPRTLQPMEIIDALNNSKGWEYRVNGVKYACRDRALIALVYLGALRISEALKARVNQFKIYPDYVAFSEIELSKSVVKGKPRNDLYRSARLPLSGERRELTLMVLQWLEHLDDKPDNAKLFNIGRKRAHQIFTAYFPDSTCHWFRAYGEDYLYENWGSDILAVADYIKVDERTLAKYIKGRHKKKPAV